MAKQTVTLRLDEDDLTYLSQVDIQGAGNLSQKIRALINEARAQREGTKDYAAAHDFARSLFARVDQQINFIELETATRSELTHRVLAWLPEAVAFMLSASECGKQSAQDSPDLEAFEVGLGERAYSIVDSLIQLAMADFSGCLAPNKLAQRASFAIRQIQ